jgi:hypothetical protein
MNTSESVREREFQNLYRGPPCFRNGFILRLENALSRGKLVDLKGLEFPFYGHTWCQEMISPKTNRGLGSRVLRCQYIIMQLRNAGILSLEHSGSFRVIQSPSYVESEVESEDDVQLQSQECTICMLQKSEFHSCTQCVHNWCSDYQSHMHRCPYCREPFHRNEQVRAVPTEEQVQHVIEDFVRFLQVN